MERTGEQALTRDALLAHNSVNWFPSSRVRIRDMTGRQLCPIGLWWPGHEPVGSLPPAWTVGDALNGFWGPLIKCEDGSYKTNANYDELFDMSNAVLVFRGEVLGSSVVLGTLPPEVQLTAVARPRGSSHSSAAQAEPYPISHLALGGAQTDQHVPLTAEQAAGQGEETPPSTPPTPPMRYCYTPGHRSDQPPRRRHAPSKSTFGPWAMLTGCHFKGNVPRAHPASLDHQLTFL